jgi:hypothetical protein
MSAPLNHLVFATRDRHIEQRVVPALARAGFDVDVVRTNLDLVRKTQPELAGKRVSALVIDTRPSSFGKDPLLWLRDERLPCAIVALASGEDTEVAEAAERAEAASVIPLPPGGIRRGGRLVRELRRTLQGTRPRSGLRWTLPRSPRLVGGAPHPGRGHNPSKKLQ